METTELLNGISEIDRGAWNALVGGGSPFLEWEWLASLEQAGAVGAETGWLPRPLVVRDGEKLLAACPLYVKGHSEGEFVFDWSWADAAHGAGIEYYPKLLVGVPFTPVSGARLLTAADAERPRRIQALGLALREICREGRFSGVHVNFCRDDELEALVEAGFMPRLGFQYHWRNRGYQSFEDYLGHFRSKRRNQIRRERRAVRAQGVSVETRVGDEIGDDLFEPMFRFYLANIRAHSWGRQYLNEKVFELLRERFRHRLCFVIARQDGAPIAGTLNVLKGDTLYGRYWGAARDVRYLHFDVCYYAAIEYCIEAGVQRFEPGAGGEYKWLRGFDPEPTRSAHFLAEPRLASAVSNFLDREREEAQEAINWYREHGAFKKAAG